MENSTQHSLFLLLLLFFILLFSVTGLQQFVILMFVVVCPILLIVDRKLLFLIYIISLPTNGFIATDENLFGVVHVLYVIHLFTLFGLLLEWGSLRGKSKDQAPGKGDLSKYASVFTLFILFYLVFTDYRLAFFGVQRIYIDTLISRTIRYFLMFIPLFFLIKLSYQEVYKKIIQNGFLISVGLVAFSMVFAEQLYRIGIEVQEIEELSQIAYQSDFIRRAGIFFSFGDTNSAAGFMAVGLGYSIFYKGWKKKILRYLQIGLIILAVISSGSRAGIISLLFVILVYFLSKDVSSRGKIVFISFILGIGFLLLGGGYIDPIIDRFTELQIGQGLLDPNYELGRVGGWLFYLDYITSDIRTLLLGTTESIYLRVGWFSVYKERVAHNFFIQLWYYWGIFPLFFLLSRVLSLIRYSFHSPIRSRLNAIILPTLTTLTFVSGVGVFIVFIVALVSLSGESKYLECS